MLGLGLSLTKVSSAISPYYAKLVNAFKARVQAGGGTVGSTACLKTDLTYLTENP